MAKKVKKEKEMPLEEKLARCQEFFRLLVEKGWYDEGIQLLKSSRYKDIFKREVSGKLIVSMGWGFCTFCTSIEKLWKRKEDSHWEDKYLEVTSPYDIHIDGTKDSKLSSNLGRTYILTKKDGKFYLNRGLRSILDDCDNTISKSWDLQDIDDTLSKIYNDGLD